MIQFAPKTQPEAVAKTAPRRIDDAAPVPTDQSPSLKQPSDSPVVSVLSLALTKPAAEPLELSGEPAPQVKNGKRPRSSKGRGAKAGKVEQLDGNNLILPLDA